MIFRALFGQSTGAQRAKKGFFESRSDLAFLVLWIVLTGRVWTVCVRCISWMGDHGGKDKMCTSKQARKQAGGAKVSRTEQAE
jgi:hypothetical protein